MSKKEKRDSSPPQPNSANTPEPMEIRECLLSEVRTVSDDKGKHIDGYAAVFNKLSLPLGWFREKIAPGAFKKAIKTDDIRSLFNHDSNYVLGRNKADTLELREDKKGLFTRTTPPDTQWAKDLMVSIDRGDITGMSFQFRTVSDAWEGKDTINPIRTLIEVKLYDISPVTFPAYPATSVSVRILAHAAAGDGDSEGLVFRGLLKLNAGEKLTDEEIKAVRTHLDSLRANLKDPAPAFKPHALALKRKKLDLILTTI